MNRYEEGMKLIEESCGNKKDNCPNMESCQTVGEIISNNPDALKKSEGIDYRSV